MKMRAADYIAQILADNGVSHVFAVVGGGAMHLDDALGNHERLHCIFNHHEQACTMAAESYARVENRMAAACVTSGPGGTNAITGVLCAWNDSIPLLVLSGQVRTDTTVWSTGLKLRQFGEQEYDIVSSVRGMTKYAEMITDGTRIRYCLEKAIWTATHGRKGPCWLDIPLDIQSMEIDTETQKPFVPVREEEEAEKERIEAAVKKLSEAKRPVLIAGSAVRGAGAYESFRKFVERIHIPTVAATAVSDLFPVSAEDYYGNFGVIGGRAGNFMVQNADCILVLGARLSLKQIGFQYEKFSPDSYKIMVEVDKPELQKKTISIDLPICMDIRAFLESEKLSELSLRGMEDGWKHYCRELKEKFPIYQKRFDASEKVNPYYFAKKLQECLAADAVTVVGNSCASDMTRQLGITKEGQRMWGNTNCGTMGYDVPAALGAAVAAGRTVYCMTGDGSIMMNIQELQTIAHNRLPVKIFIHNNEGYEAIVNTHTNFFGRLTGCTAESGISFPDFELLAKAFGMPYCRCRNHEEVDRVLPGFVTQDGYGICEICSDEKQIIEPKTKSRLLENGKMYSPPIDDLFPFLEEEEYRHYAVYSDYTKEREGKQDECNRN